ncbi:MAG: outer membrane protein [Xanthobacteraceae bacterium]
MRHILGLALAVAITGPAMAADLPAAMPMKSLPAYVPAYSWTGFYFGGNIGGAWGQFDYGPSAVDNISGTVTTPPSTSVTNSSVVGGVQSGYNWEIGNLVLGFESDIQFTGLKQGFTFAGPGAFAGDALSSKVDYLSTVRGKAGWVWDRFMLYAAGGLATGEMDTTASYVAGASPALSFTDAHKLHTGYTVGGGAEYAVTNNVSFGVEYRYLDLGNETYNLGAFTPVGGHAQTVSSTVDLKSSEVLARLNIRLHGLGLFGM